jgi:hypothetical protein
LCRIHEDAADELGLDVAHGEFHVQQPKVKEVKEVKEV